MNGKAIIRRWQRTRVLVLCIPRLWGMGYGLVLIIRGPQPLGHGPVLVRGLLL